MGNTVKFIIGLAVVLVLAHGGLWYYGANVGETFINEQLQEAAHRADAETTYTIKTYGYPFKIGFEISDHTDPCIQFINGAISLNSYMMLA
mgnify:CR=1 FL=1